MNADRLDAIRSRDALGLPDGATLSGIEWWARTAQEDRAALLAERDALVVDLAAATAMLAVLCDAPGAADFDKARALLAELEADHG